MDGRTDATRTARHSRLRVRRPGTLTLNISGVPDHGKVVLQGRKLVVGRSRGCDVTLDDPSVSSRHFELRVGHVTTIRDLGSKNGTFINDRLVYHAAVMAGDSIRAGVCTLQLERVDELEIDVCVEDSFGELYGQSLIMREVFAELGRLAGTELSVLVTGETGTGKELAARGIHERSERKEGPFVVVDCAALPSGLAESMLFGHRRGAFTGASSEHAGYFEQAQGGTVFLDEIGELPIELQPKLLRVLDRKEVQRVGDARYRAVDVRVVAATHRDLRELVAVGRFRKDLFFRLSQSEVELPPLRERGQDVELLALRFLRQATGDLKVTLMEEAERALRARSWPGNVRQLRNAMMRTAALCNRGEAGVNEIGAADPAQNVSRIDDLLSRGGYDDIHDEVDRTLLARVLAENGHNPDEVGPAAGDFAQAAAPTAHGTGDARPVGRHDPRGPDRKRAPAHGHVLLPTGVPVGLARSTGTHAFPAIRHAGLMPADRQRRLSSTPSLRSP